MNLEDIKTIEDLMKYDDYLTSLNLHNDIEYDLYNAAYRQVYGHPAFDEDGNEWEEEPNMIENIIKTVDAYLITNMDVLDTKQKAELKAQIAYLKEFNKDSTIKKDQKVTRKEFLDLYKAAMEMICYYDGSDEKERFNHLYGYPVEVHWNGVYCDCSDGATAWNHIVSNIEGVIEEEDE